MICNARRRFFEDLELRSSGTVEFSKTLNLGASGLQNYEAVLGVSFCDFREAETVSSPGEDFGCAGAALGGLGATFSIFLL